jgi:hypothetical protein
MTAMKALLNVTSKSRKISMPVFGGSREPSPILESDDTVLETETPIVVSLDEAQLLSEHESENDAVEGSDNEDLTSSRLSKKNYQQYRRWYYNDFNLVNAFESAAAGDLAHNLLGFTLEKRAHLPEQPAPDSQVWTSKTRWMGDSEDRNSQATSFWTAWPVHPERLPARNMLLDPRPNPFSQPPRKKRKSSHRNSELEEVLSGLMMGHARDQFSIHKQRAAVSSAEQKRNVAIQEAENVELSIDEDQSFMLLKPAVEQVTISVAKLFAGLKASRSAQFPRPRKRSKRNRQDQRLKTYGQSLSSVQKNAATHSESEDSSAATTSIPFGLSTTDQPGLRDWSDILAMAAALGWNASAVHRAAARCSNMFGESMSLMSKGAEAAPIDVSIQGLADNLPSLEGWSLWDGRCPHPDCERHHIRDIKYLGYLIDHIVAKHNWDPRIQTADQFASPPPLNGWSLTTLQCPHGDCRKYGKVFAKPFLIVDHMLKYHHWDPRVQQRRDVSLVDGVHVDGYLEAIPGVPNKPVIRQG